MSTIAEEITDLQNNLQSAKNAVTTKGGTVGDTGLAGLATEIASIPAGGGPVPVGDYGKVTYYTAMTFVVEDIMAFGCEAEVVDAEKVAQFVEDDSVGLEYDGTQELWSVGWEGEAQYTTAQLETEVGVRVTDIQGKHCEVEIRGTEGVDKSAGKKECSLDALADFEQFFKTSGIALPNGDTIVSAQVSDFVLGSEITEIGDNFLSDSKSLVSFDCTLAENLETIGNNFLRSTNKLKDAIEFPLVTEVGDYFLFGSGVEVVKMPELDTVGNWFCASSRIQSIFDLSKLRSIGSDFCSTSTIVAVQFPETIETIGNSCLMNCSSLTALRFSYNTSSLQSIGFGFAAGCSSLDTVAFPQVTDISGCFPSGDTGAFSGCQEKALIYLYGMSSSGVKAQVQAKYPNANSGGVFRKWRSW